MSVENESLRKKAVLPIDLLAFTVIATRIVDTSFVKAKPTARQLGGQFGLDAKTVGGQRQALDALAAEDLVTGFHVREIEVAEHVREQRKESVGHEMPEQQHAVGQIGRARTVDDVRSPVEDRTEQG